LTKNSSHLTVSGGSSSSIAAVNNRSHASVTSEPHSIDITTVSLRAGPLAHATLVAHHGEA
jgi:hypothetical protein